MSRGKKPHVWTLLIIAAIAIPGWGGAVEPPVEDPAGPQKKKTRSAEQAMTGRPPQIIPASQKAPPYPPAALAGRFTGSVKVSVKVLSDGTVGEVKVLECSHRNIGFEEAAVAAVKEWRFEPALGGDGHPIEYTTSYRLNFRNSGRGRGFNPFVSSGAAEDVPTTTQLNQPKQTTPTRSKP